FWMFFNAPGGSFSNSTRPASIGQTIRLDIGVDIADRVVAGVMLQAASNRASSDYLGTTGVSASGDFSELLPGVSVKVNLVGINDSQDVQRLWLYLRAAAAAGLYFPKSLIDKFDIMIQGGPGIEYYTKLRHFAVGFELSFVFMALTQTIGMSAPTV